MLHSVKTAMHCQQEDLKIICRVYDKYHITDITCALEDTGVAVAVSLSKSLHHPVDLLCFTRQTKTPQELSIKKNKQALI